MPDLIHSKLGQVRRALQRCLWGGGVAALVAAVCAAVFVSGWLDVWIVRDSPSGRVVLSLAVLTVVVVTFRRELWRPLRVRITDAWLARKIESCYPRLGGALASSVEFLEGRYAPGLGSPELQHQSVLDSVEGIYAIDPARVVNARPMTRRIGLAAIALLACVAWAVFDPSHAWASLQRLCFPLARIDLPRDVHLQLLDPDDGHVLTAEEIAARRFPRGSVWELTVVNTRGELPDDLRWLHRGRLQRQGSESIPRQPVDPGEPSRALLRLEMRESFEFRVAGGDDESHPWYSIQVVPPPTLRQLELVLESPEYTNRPPQTIPSGLSFVQTVLGSRLQVRGTSETPLAEARLKSRNQTVLELELGDDGQSFAGTLPVDDTGTRFLSLELTDLEGVTNTAAMRLELLGVADRPPTIEFLSPATDLYLTPSAKLNVHSLARDDFGLLRVELTIAPRELDAAGDLPRPAIVLLPPESKGVPLHESRTEVTFSELGFTAGQRLLLRLTADDALPRDAQRPGLDEREITLVETSEKLRELAGRLEEILERIRREERAQRLLRESLPAGSTPAAPPELPLFIQEQRRLQRALTDVDAGVLGELHKLIGEFELNRIEEAIFLRRLENLRDDLAQLESGLFPSLNHFLSRWSQIPAGSEASPPPLPDFADPVDPAALQQWLESVPEAARDRHLSVLVADRQARIERQLRLMSGTLADWREDQSLKDALSELIDRQRELSRSIARLKSETLGKSLDQLSPRDRARLEELSEQLRGIQQRLSRFRDELREQSRREDTPRAVADLAARVAESRADADLAELSRELQENHLAQAEKRGQELEREFQDWDGLLNDRPITDAELKLKLLEEQSRAVAELRRRQRTLDEHTTQAEASGELPAAAPQLAAEQQSVADVAGRVERALNRIALPQPADALRQAGADMQSASESLERATRPGEQFANIAETLERVERELHERAEQLRAENARQLASRLLPALKLLREQQDRVWKDSTELLARQQAAGRWDRAALRSLNDLRKEQTGLTESLERTAEPVRSFESIALAADGLAREMRRAADSLGERRLTEAVHEHQPQVLQRLDILIGVLGRSAESDSAAGQNGATNDPPPAENDDPSRRDLGLELTVLRAVQEQIHERMRGLAEREAGAGLTPELREEWTDLENEQSRLLDLLTEMFREQGLSIPP